MSEWKKLKAAALSSAERIVVKVGSAVLTTENGLNLRTLTRLVDQIAVLHDQGKRVVLVSSGAVAAGRKAIMHCTGCKDDGSLPAVQAVSAIGQSRLMHEYDEAFGNFGKTTAQILLTRDDFRSRSRFLNARNTIRTLLDWRVIPIINENDTVAVAELKFGDNDFLGSLVLSLVDADIFVNLTSASGVYTENPDENPGAKAIECIDNISGLDIDGMCSGKTAAGSGGMRSKLMGAKRASQLAVPTLVLNGKEPFALERAFKGEDIGTWIMPCDHAVPMKKFWMAYHSDPVGVVRVDAGAARALEKNGKSLLPAGIVGVEGRFSIGALVRVAGPDDRTIGVGLTNYAAAELRKIQGRKSSEVEELLGHSSYPEVIHRDHMLLDPAL